MIWGLIPGTAIKAGTLCVCNAPSSAGSDVTGSPRGTVTSATACGQVEPTFDFTIVRQIETTTSLERPSL